mgnify:FL=1
MTKKKGIDITGALSAFDNEYVTEPKAELGIKKGDKKLDVSVSKPFSKVSKENLSSTIGATFTKEGKDSLLSLTGSKTGKSKNVMFSFSKSFEKGKEVKKGRMFTAAEVRALDEAKSAKNYKKKDRIKSSGDKERIELMGTDLRKYTEGGMCRGAGAAIKGTKFKGVF